MWGADERNGTKMKIGIADYGMFVWYGAHFDYEERIAMAKELGYLGLERLYPTSAEDALRKAAWLKRNGMSFATCNGPTPELSIQWSAALGAEYVWAEVQGKTLDNYIRQISEQARIAAKYGVKVAVHNHLGSLVESQAEIERVMKECPDVYLLFDTGHLGVAGGDVKYIADTYYDRIVAYHLKGWTWSDTPTAANWWERGYFTGLKQGNLDIDNEYVFKNACRRGFGGWVMIEQDTHKRDPRLDLSDNMAVLKGWQSELK